MAKTYSSFDNRNIKALISQYKLYKDILTCSPLISTPRC